MTRLIPKNPLGNTGLEVSVVGFGGASLGNLYQAVSDEEASKTLAAAIKAGISFYDTAPRYGAGLSERRVGDALRGLNRSDYVLSTKAGRLLRPDPGADPSILRHGFLTPMPFEAHYDYTYDGIMRSYEDSLQRLGLSEIDILLVHDIGIDTHTDKDAFYFEQFRSSGYKAVAELRDKKCIKAIGLGVNETEVCERVMAFGQFDCFLLAGRYSLLEQEPIDSFLPKCEAHGASIILGGAYNSGILATGVRREGVQTYYNYEPAPTDIIERVACIEDVCDDFGVTLAAAALQFPLAHSSVQTVIPGMGSERRIKQTFELLNEAIPAAFWAALKQRSLLHEDAPVPTGREA